MRQLLAFAAIQAVLILMVGALAGYAVHDAQQARARLRADHDLTHQALTTLEADIRRLEENVREIEISKRDATNAWRVRQLASLAQQEAIPTTWPPPRRGMGGGIARSH